MAEMRRQNLTQAVLSRKSGLIRQTISNYVNNPPDKPDLDVFSDLAKGLGLPLSILLENAGYINELTDSKQVAEKVAAYKLSELNEEQLDRIIEYIEFIQDRASPTSYVQTKRKKTREGSPPPEQVKDKVEQ